MAAAAMQLPMTTSAAQSRRSWSRKAGYPKGRERRRGAHDAREAISCLLKRREGQSNSDHGHGPTESRTTGAPSQRSRSRKAGCPRGGVQAAPAHSA